MTDKKASVPMIEKAERAIDLAGLILGADAAVQDLEDMGVSLMYLPLAELEKMRARLKPAVLSGWRQGRTKR